MGVEATERRYSLAQKLWWLIAGRLSAALFLFLARAVWLHGSNTRAWATTLSPLLIVVALTAVYSAARMFSSALLLQARIQFFIDILLVTWLLWTTDVIHSPFIAVYIVVIAASSLFLGPRDAIVVSLGCAIAFTASALAVLNGYGNLSTDQLVGNGRVQTFQSIVCSISRS